MVRAQGGTAEAVRLGLWSQRLLRRQRDELGIDSGFVAQGYLLPCFTAAEVTAARERIAMQQGLGLDVDWLSPDEFDAVQPALAPGLTLGGSVLRRATATSTRRATCSPTPPPWSGRRRGPRARPVHRPAPRGGRVAGVEPPPGRSRPARVVLTGGPKLAEVGRLAGCGSRSGGVRHQVVVTEPHPDLAPARLPMVFDLVAGIYWRPEEGGVLWGMSNPDEPPGWATEFD